MTMARHLRRLGLALCLCWLGGAALAVQPSERLDDPQLEARARAISQELRCLVCQNQSIDDSDAGLARDLRLLVRERLAAGDSDAETIAFIVQRYGDFVLLRPPVKPATYALWAAPLLLLLTGLWMLRRLFRRRNDSAPPPLSADEQAALARRMDEDQRA